MAAAAAAYAGQVRFLGIDFGSKKVGLALSDEEGRMAFPRETLKNDGALCGLLLALMKAEGVGGVVMGQSRNFAGGENPIASQAEVFAHELKERSGIPVHFEPEIFTTKEAERLTGRSTDVDAAAAAIILQSYLDRQRDHA